MKRIRHDSNLAFQNSGTIGKATSLVEEIVKPWQRHKRRHGKHEQSDLESLSGSGCWPSIRPIWFFAEENAQRNPKQKEDAIGKQNGGVSAQRGQSEQYPRLCTRRPRGPRQRDFEPPEHHGHPHPRKENGGMLGMAHEETGKRQP